MIICDSITNRTLLLLSKYQERARAEEFGYEDPINPNYEATTEQYHKCLLECMQRMHELKKVPGMEKRVGIMVASHNADTIRFAIEKYDGFRSSFK